AASVLPTESHPEPEQARRRALNQALHLASLAPHGSVLVPLALRPRLPAPLQLQPLEVDGMAVCRVQRA
ncbi:MAG TPA: hypothetical protein VK195_03840, partial [Burkholderiaceae bacterium]|nr:hypothetical protein [Burkholderiaceae bacterium]